MKKIIFFCLLAIIGISFSVPELSSMPTIVEHREYLSAVNINAAGDRIMVRTDDHDYEFMLPKNTINEIIAYAPTSTEIGFWYLNDLHVSATGKTHAVIHSRYGPGIYGINFKPGGVAKSKALGYKDGRNTVETSSIHEMLYSIDMLEGQQYAAGTKGALSGENLQGKNQREVYVETVTAENIGNESKIKLFKPFIAIKKAIEFCFFIPLLFFAYRS